LSTHLGVELGPTSLRAVGLSSWRRSSSRAIEIAWDPERPAEAFAALSGHFGRVGHVAAAVDLRLLHVKRLRLPDVSTSERRRILAMEPERFLPVRGAELVFAVRQQQDLVFAAPEALVALWLEGLRGLGPVERIEPAPFALARALSRLKTRDALVLRSGQGGGVELTEIKDGRLARTRRLFGEIGDAAEEVPSSGDNGADGRSLYLAPWDETQARIVTDRCPGYKVEPAPAPPNLDAAFLAAYGAALGDGEDWRETLLTPELESEIGRRRRTRLGLGIAAFVVAVVFAIASLDAYRERAERALDARITALQEQASEALALQARAETLGGELRALSEIQAEKPDPLNGLLDLTRRLPAGTWIRSVRVADGEWQLDGYARDAAALIPTLEADPRFEDVRFLAATSRAQLGSETYENFSLALRTVRAP